MIAVRQGKGKKDRFVPIGERALVWTRKYLDDIRPQHALPSSPNTVFLDETGKALDPHKVSRAVKKYVKQAEIDKAGSCHLFRHTMATLMLENGADIRFIQQMLGHSQLSTTEIYTHLAIHKLKEIHTATHPGRLKDRQGEGDAAPALNNIGIDIDPRPLAEFECDYPVQRINGCAHRFLAGYDYRGYELIYSDPPYLKQTRTSGRRYRYDYEEHDHIELLELLKRLPCPVIVSGYPSALYDELLAQWRNGARCKCR